MPRKRKSMLVGGSWVKVPVETAEQEKKRLAKARERRKRLKEVEKEVSLGWGVADAREIKYVNRDRPQRKKHLLRKRFIYGVTSSEEQEGIFAKLKKAKIPIAAVFERPDEKILVVKDLSKGKRLRAVDAHSPYLTLHTYANAKSLVAGMARDLARMHNNNLWISGNRYITEPWLFYFRGKKKEGEGIASRAIVDAGAIRELPRKQEGLFEENLERLRRWFREYAEVIEETYRKYRK